MSPPSAAAEKRAASMERLMALIPDDGDEMVIRAGRMKVRLTNLSKVFFPDDGLTKRDLLRYYAGMGPMLIPHLRDRAP